MTRSIFYRIRWWVFAFYVLITPFVVYAAKLAVESNSNNVADWLPESFQETRDLKWFAERFGTDAILMLSWEGCDLQDARIAPLAEELLRPVSLGPGDNVTLYTRVLTGQQVFQQLQQPPLDLSVEAARARLAGWLLGPDGHTTCLVAAVAEDGWQYRHNILEHIQACANRLPDFDGVVIRVAGSVLDSVEIDRASNELLVELSVASYSLCFLLMLGLLRSLWLSGMVFINAMFCQQLGLALVYISGTQMDSVLLMVPMLIFVLAVSAGIHLVNYYLDALAETSVRNAPSRAVHDALAPCWLASATTALGLLSLLSSKLIPVQKFGWFAAVAVVLGTVVLFTLLPSQLEQASPRIASNRRSSSNSSDAFFRMLLRFVWVGRYLILLVSLVLTGIGLNGLARLRAGVRIHDMFSTRASILQDYDWLESHIGPLVPFEIVLRLPKSDETAGLHPMIEKLQTVASVHRAAANTEGIGAVVSAWNFCPPLTGIDGRGARQVIRRAVVNRKLEAARVDYIDSGLLKEMSDEELWRVSGRAYAGRDLDYGRVMANLRANLTPILQLADAGSLPGISVVYCGGVPLVQKAQNQMLSDLFKSFLLAFGFIGIVMGLLMVGLSIPEMRLMGRAGAAKGLVRGFAAGLLAMVPNLVPCVLVLGLMGLLGARIEIGSMMTASVALGIAVDDTLHFLTWFRRGLHRTNSRHQAVAYAYNKCGLAMIQTSVICGVGLLAYAFSPFLPVARFAWVMSSMLGLALVADLLILPAMLLTPIGAVFEPPRQREIT